MVDVVTLHHMNASPVTRNSAINLAIGVSGRRVRKSAGVAIRHVHDNASRAVARAWAVHTTPECVTLPIASGYPGPPGRSATPQNATELATKLVDVSVMAAAAVASPAIADHVKKCAKHR